MAVTIADCAKMIDHSLLHPTMTDADLRAGCLLAREYECATVCIKPYAVPLAAELLAGSSVGVCAVAGFPHGNSHTEIIIAEAVRACSEGATEIDIVCNTGKVLGGDWAYVTAELKAVNQAVVAKQAILKIIFENDFLQDQHIIALCEICSELDIAFVKTSSGYGMVKQSDGSYSSRGATHGHVKLMRAHCKPSVQVKAAGGIRTLDDLLHLRALGASRIGTSATAAIVQEGRARRAAGEPLVPSAAAGGGNGGY